MSDLNTDMGVIIADRFITAMVIRHIKNYNENPNYKEIIDRKVKKFLGEKEYEK